MTGYVFIPGEKFDEEYDWADISLFIEGEDEDGNWGFWCPDQDGNNVADFLEGIVPGPDYNEEISEDNAGG